MYLGFDIGGTSARASLYDADWRAVSAGRRRVREATAPAQVADLVADMIDELVDEAGEARDSVEIEGVGIGLAAQLGPEGRTVINAPNLGWRDEPFAERVGERLREAWGALDIALVNDLNALLWGEHYAGALEDVDDALAVYVGTGVGGALMSGGRLTVGARGVAGEIGHSKVVPGGRLCGCGEHGCLEAYAGGIHLERQVAALADEASGLEDVFADAADDATADAVDLAVADELARAHEQLGELWRQATDFLAMVVANACTLLNPAVLLVGGGVVENCDYFREQFLTKTSPLVLEVARESLEMREPALGDDAGMLGAARLAARR